MFQKLICLGALVAMLGCTPNVQQAGSGPATSDSAPVANTPAATPADTAGDMPPAAGSSARGETPAATGVPTAAPAKPPVRPAPAATPSGGPSIPTELNPPSNAGLPPAVTPAGAAPGTVLEKAGVGSAKRGRSLDDEKGIGAVIAQPAKSLFAFQERAVFEIEIPGALKLFNATQGRAPKSHEEFMTHIIKANNIKLPELPAGHRYQYDPDRGELMVEKPGR